jgi:hypothetical protein
MMSDIEADTDMTDFNEKIAALCVEGNQDELFESAYGMVSVAIYRALESNDPDTIIDACEQVELTRRLLGQGGIALLAKLRKLENEGNADVSVPNPEG